MSGLEEQVKTLIVDALALEIEPHEIVSDAPLFGDGLGLDSIDALELGVAIHKKYGIEIEVQAEEVRECFASVKNLAAFVRDRQCHQDRQ